MASVWGLVRRALLWTSFKLVQTVVAAFFTLLVWAQTFVSLIERIFRHPPALLTVQQARQLAADKSQLQAAVATALAADDSSLQQSDANNADGLRQRRLPDACQHSSTKQGQEGHADQRVTSTPIHVFPEPQLGESYSSLEALQPLKRLNGTLSISWNPSACIKQHPALHVTPRPPPPAPYCNLTATCPLADCPTGYESLAWQLVGPYMRAYGRHAIANSQLFNPEFIHFFVPGVGSMPYIIVEL
jgi:hypothetical protein